MLATTMFDFFEYIWIHALLISFWAAFPLFLWGMIDSMLLLKQNEHRLKRGFKIAAKPLKLETSMFLESLQKKVVEKRKLLFREVTAGFILVKGQERLIQIRKEKWRTSWPYVGYVDLSQPIPMLEFRASLPMHLALLPFVVSLVALPFVAFMMWINYRNETKTIEQFLEQKAKEIAEEPI